MNLSEQLAYETVHEGEKVVEVFVDPATILLTAKIILTLVSLYKNCKKKPIEASMSCQQMSFIEKRIIKREVRKQMGGVKYLSNGGSKLADKIISRAQRINTQEMESLYEEV